MTQTAEDTYFFDRDLAYQTALAHNVVELPNGEKQTQICYYDGEPFDHAPDNLIHVPAPRFTEIFVTKPLRLPTKIESCTNTQAANEQNHSLFQQKFSTLLRKVRQLRAQKAAQNSGEFFQDTFFIDPLSAYETALLRLPVKTAHPTRHGLQICYYTGDDEFDFPPDNLVKVPNDNALEFFINTRFRLPSNISFPPSVNQDDARATSLTFNELLHEAVQQRSQIGHELATNCRLQSPEPVDNHKYKILIRANRYLGDQLERTEILAPEFIQLGCSIHIVTEQNDMDCIDMPWLYKEHLEFNPHITINFMHQDTHWLHDDVYNIELWQTEDTTNAENLSIHWRERDIVISSSEKDTTFLKQTGAKHIIEHTVDSKNVLNTVASQILALVSKINA